MYICKVCGKTYEYLEDIEEKVEEIEDADGYIRERRYYYECCCGSNQIEEADKCKLCGEWKVKDYNEVCEKCLTIDNCWKYGEEHKQCLELNGFVASMFDTSEIEEILMRELKEAEQLRHLDKYDFKEYLDN